ncbi:aspartyl-tRNA synthetase, partial [Trifolium medium]|nr:aspartyl-tRNA synthetase [Trifolium medium]
MPLFRVLKIGVLHHEYEKISNRDSAKAIFDSLRMTHEGNELAKETKALALIQKYESFKMNEDEDIGEMFSRFQTLVVGLKVLNKWYTTADHVKKIVRSLPLKWRPMVTALKISKDLNSTTLEELISSLRSH